MSEFDRRLQACAQRYSEDLRRPAGGIGEDRFVGAPVSIVNTAEILTVFRAARLPYKARGVQQGLKFIAEKVDVHPLRRGTHPEARGRSTRYAAFGLLGLTSYPEALHDPAFEKGQLTCVGWLAEHELPSGGWSESARAAELSLLSTQAAVEALERLCARLPDAEQLEGLCDRARRACLGHGAADGVDEARVRWWPQVAGDDEPSPSATALAVLLLSRGNAHQQRAAREGVDWLFRHAAQWDTATEGDAHSRTANWRHMTFSLGLRAVLSLPDISPRRRELQRTIALLDELWHEEQGGWSHGKPGIDATPTGCQAVVLAVEALAGSYRFDPDDLLVRKSRRPPRSPGHAARREVCLDSDGFLTVIDLGDRRVLDRHPLRARVASTKEGVVRLLIERQLAHPGGTLEEVSMTTAELRDGLGIEPQSIAKAISRLNDELAAAAPFDNGTLAELIQPVNAARRLPDRRWRIDADAFSLDRPADKTRPDGAVIGR